MKSPARGQVELRLLHAILSAPEPETEYQRVKSILDSVQYQYTLARHWEAIQKVIAAGEKLDNAALLRHGLTPAEEEEISLAWGRKLDDALQEILTSWQVEKVRKIGEEISRASSAAEIQRLIISAAGMIADVREIQPAKMTPTMSAWKIGGYTLALQDVRREDGATTAELQVWLGNRLRFIGRLNLLSSRSRAEVSRHLDSIFSGYNWKTVLERISIQAMEYYRQGDPPVVITTEMKPPDRKYLFAPYVMEKEITLLYGEGGVGKSLFSIWLGGQIQRKTGQVVCILDWETHADEFHRRNALVSAGFGVDIIPMVYLHCCAPISQELDRIARVIAEYSVGMLIVDSAFQACGADMERAASVEAFFQSLRVLGCTTLVLTHTQKNSDQKTPFGSVYWTNSPRMVWHMYQEDDYVVLENVKNNIAPIAPPVAYRIQWREGGVIFSETSSPPRLRRSVREIIYDFLRRSGPQTASAIATALALKIDTVRKTLDRYAGRDFEVGGEGKWRVKDKEEQTK